MNPGDRITDTQFPDCFYEGIVSKIEEGVIYYIVDRMVWGGEECLNIDCNEIIGREIPKQC